MYKKIIFSNLINEDEFQDFYPISTFEDKSFYKSIIDYYFKQKIDVEIEEIINYANIIYEGYINLADFTKIDSFLDLIEVIFDDFSFFYKKKL